MNRKLILILLLLLCTNIVSAKEQQANFLVIEGNNRISNEEITDILDFKSVKYITMRISQI